MPHYLQCKKCQLYIPYKFTLFHFKIFALIAPCPVTADLGEKSLSVLLTYQKTALAAPEPSLPQAEQFQLSKHFFIGGGRVPAL